MAGGYRGNILERIVQFPHPTEHSVFAGT